MPGLHGQDAGTGTFNDLVGDVVEAPPSLKEQKKTFSIAGVETTITTEEPSWKFQPGLEYDYRFNQQKSGDLFATNVNELHFPFTITYGLSRFGVDYFHVWTDASNDVGSKRSSEINGLKAAYTQTIYKSKPLSNDEGLREFTFSFPFFFREEDRDDLTELGNKLSDINSYIVNPFVVASISWPLDMCDEERYRNLKASIAPGYRLILTDQDFANVNHPGVHGWKGFTSLLPRIDYDICNLLSIYGSGTWNHVTNFFASNNSLPPDHNNFSLATGISIKPRTRTKTKSMKEADCRPLSLSLSYQYDGFNRDFYQHSVTVGGSYKF